MKEPAARVRDVAAIVEDFAPPALAFPDDSIGLQVGDEGRRIRLVAVALDPSPAMVGRAAAAGADLLVTHHPLFHERPARIATATPVGAAAAAAIGARMSIYAAHTNLDAAPRGLSWELTRRAGLEPAEFFGAPGTAGWLKLAVFVPEVAAAAVRDAMAAAGAGVIGAYDRCAFMSPGTGFFRGGPEARPSAGRRGRIETVTEVRLEMLVPEHRLNGVTEAMRRAHPYEEAAFDVYQRTPAPPAGPGCIGTMRRTSTRAFVSGLSRSFSGAVRVSGAPPARIDTVAVVPGSGGGLLAEALRRGAGLLVTGEVRYHQMLDAAHGGIGIVELGHDVSEMPAVPLLARVIRKGLRRGGHRVAVKTVTAPRAARIVWERK